MALFRVQVFTPTFLVYCIIIHDIMKRRFGKWKKRWYKGKQLQYTSRMIFLPIIKKIAGEHGAMVRVVDETGEMVYWCLDKRLDTADVNNFMNELGLNDVQVSCTLVTKSG